MNQLTWPGIVNHGDSRFEIQNQHVRVAVVDRLADAKVIQLAPEMLEMLKSVQISLRSLEHAGCIVANIDPLTAAITALIDRAHA
jgi:hypothetical protein